MFAGEIFIQKSKVELFLNKINPPSRRNVSDDAMNLIKALRFERQANSFLSDFHENQNHFKL